MLCNISASEGRAAAESTLGAAMAEAAMAARNTRAGRIEPETPSTKISAVYMHERDAFSR